MGKFAFTNLINFLKSEMLIADLLKCYFNLILTFNRHTAGTPLPTAENIYCTADGKNETNKNETKFKLDIE